MPTVDVMDLNRQKVEEIDLPEDIFNLAVRPDVLHAVVRWQLAKRRLGTSAVKTRAEVSGGGRKPWRQKGTGRARSGSNRSPVWRHGGVIHAKKPRDYSYKLNKKVRQLGLKMALSAKLQGQQLMVLADLSLDEPKTKLFAGLLKNLDLTKALFVTPVEDEKVERSSRNIPDVKIVRPEGLNVYDVLKYDHLVLTKPSVAAILERLS